MTDYRTNENCIYWLAREMPSFRNSPTVRDEPQPGLATDTLRISALTFLDIGSLPGLPLGLKLAE